jgi:hypothetical protein
MHHHFFGPTASALAEAAATLKAERDAMWAQISHNQVGPVGIRANDALTGAESLSQPTVGDQIASIGTKAIHELTEA